MAINSKHNTQRRALLPYAYGQPCPLCGEEMKQGQALDLDHVTPRAMGGIDGPVRMTHARCNRSRGSRMLAKVRNPTSRRW